MSTEPQSIIHKFIRLEQKLVKSIKSKRRPSSKIGGRRQGSSSSLVSLSSPSSWGLSNSCHRSRKPLSSSSLCGTTTSTTTMNRSFSSSYMTAGTDDTASVTSNMSVETATVSLTCFDANSTYPTVNQNEFMTNYLLKDCPLRTIYLHLYVDGSYFSAALDKQMEELSHIHQDLRFVRMNIRRAPFFASKFNVSTRRPTIVAINTDGTVLNRITDFVNVDCSELKQWVDTIELLHQQRI